MKKLLSLVLIFSLIFALGLTGCGQEDEAVEDPANEEKGTITFGVTPWTSTIPPTYVAKVILEDMGYKVELQNADVGVVYAGLSRGDIDVFMDSWLPDMHKNYMEQYKDSIDDVAISYKEGELGWVVPASVEFNSIEDIKGNEDLFEGKIYGIEEGAGMSITSREMIDAYGLELDYVPSGEPAMLAQVTKEISEGNPVLFLGWRPHSMFAKWDLKVLEDTKGYFKTSEVHVLTNANFKNEAPEAYEFLKNWSIPVNDVEQMILDIDEGADPQERAEQWVEENQDLVNQMLGK